MMFRKSFFLALVFAAPAFGQEAVMPERILQPSGEICAIAFSPDGRTIVSAGSAIQVWDAESGSVIKNFVVRSTPSCAADFSADGTLLAVGNRAGSIRIIELKSGQEVRRIKSRSGAMTAIRFSPDGKFLASCGSESFIKIWRADRWKKIRTLKARSEFFVMGNWSPNGRYLCAGDGSGIRVWRSEDWKEAGWPSRSYILSGLEFFHDGRFLASAHQEPIAMEHQGAIKIWKLDNVSEIKKIQADFNGVNAIAISPDDHYLAAANGDGKIRIWKTSNWEEILSINADSKNVSLLKFSPEKNILASTGSDGLIKIWSLASILK